MHAVFSTAAMPTRGLRAFARRLSAAREPAVAAFAKRLAAVRQPGTVRVRLDDESRIATLTLANAERRNSITGPMMAQLADAVDELAAWERGAGLIVTGEGERAFCSGADYDLARTELRTPDDGELMSTLMSTTLDRLRSLPLLSVSAIDGVAMGGGAEMCTATDWRVLGRGAHIRFVHARMGASPGWGGAARLVSLVGRGTALRLLAGGARVEPEEAVRLGLSEMTAADGESAEAAARRMLGAIVEGAASVQALRAIKRAVVASSGVDDAARREETAALRSVWATEEMLGRFDRKPGS